MTAHPHDVADLYLAPVVLAVDARIEELGQLDPEALARRIALDGDLADWTSDLRQAGLIRALGHLIELHDWKISLAQRGIKLTHKQHALTLGIPQTLTDYVSTDASAGSGTRAAHAPHPTVPSTPGGATRQAT